MKCRICGKEFSRRHNEVTCSAECSRINKNRRNNQFYHLNKKPKPRKVFPPVNCRICGVEFVPTTSNGCLCGDACRREAQKQNQKKHYNRAAGIGDTAQCIICGAEFVKKKKVQKCCSEPCTRENRKRLTRQYERENRDMYKGVYEEIDTTPFYERTMKTSARQAKISREARRLGLSYGQYQAYKNLPENEREIYLNSIR